MNVKVDQIKSNPYRKIEKYPISRDKVEALKNSISETSFWDNILARKSNGGVEIAYGHHRLIALKELGIEEVDIPVRDLSDAHMIKIMANENMDDWKTATSVVNETIWTTKEFIEKEVAKYETWEEAEKVNTFINLFENKAQFGQAKGKQGIGQTTILKFLGGNWKQWMIQEALSTLVNKEIFKNFLRNIEKSVDKLLQMV